MPQVAFITSTLNEFIKPSIIEYSYFKNKYLKLSVLDDKT